jgi:hypothetical protein
MNTTENNKLIAEFMGLRYGRSSVRTYVIENNIEVLTKDLKYHTSWDWLMPVVEAIDHLEYESERLDKIDRAIKSRHIGNTCNAVVEFIKWYNENK